MIICNIHGIYYIVFFNHSLPTISQQPFLKDSHPRLDFCFTLKEHDAQGRTTKWRSHFIVANRCYLLLLFGGDCGDDHCKSSCHVKVTRQENLRQLTWGECWLGQWILDFWMKVHHFFFFAGDTSFIPTWPPSVHLMLFRFQSDATASGRSMSHIWVNWDSMSFHLRVTFRMSSKGATRNDCTMFFCPDVVFQIAICEKSDELKMTTKREQVSKKP